MATLNDGSMIQMAAEGWSPELASQDEQYRDMMVRRAKEIAKGLKAFARVKKRLEDRARARKFNAEVN